MPTTDKGEMPTNAGGPCAVPLVERLLSVPKDAREMIEVGPCHHRNIPYGSMCHEAAASIADLTRQLTEAKRDGEKLAHVNIALGEEKVGFLADLATLRRQSAALQERNTQLEGALKEMDRLATREGWNTSLYIKEHHDAVQTARAILALQGEPTK